ncbi:ChbG/HpnK family deacetylase [Acidobacteria bacterium AH-259-D05]|nr:ChbG/HpnK family deacetylase [Acidobacteria bacterium AH-259-D05]
MNADDFGLHPAINRGVCQAHLEGILTSASIMACGRAYEEAINCLSSCRRLGIGVHLTLVEERPVSPPEKVESLLQGDGRMPKSYTEFIQGWVKGRVSEKHVRRELEAQIRTVLDSGIRLTHLDSHQHLHIIPGVWKITLELARKYQIPYVRLPSFDSVGVNARSRWESVLRLAVNAAATGRRWFPPKRVRFADQVKGLSFSGRMTKARLSTILSGINVPLTEIMVHPGVNDEDLCRTYGSGLWAGFDWETELKALTDPEVCRQCSEGHFALTNFAEVNGCEI